MTIENMTEAEHNILKKALDRAFSPEVIREVERLTQPVNKREYNQALIREEKINGRYGGRAEQYE